MGSHSNQNNHNDKYLNIMDLIEFRFVDRLGFASTGS